MRNPWLDIPLSDYEAHMALPSIGQSRMLGETLASLVERYAPRSVAILGCAGGNGIERLAPMGLDRIVGVDINPEYVAATRERFGKDLRNLELYTADIESVGTLFASVDLVCAALVFEYVDVRKALSFVRRHLPPGGRCATVLQRRHERIERVSPSPYTSLRQLDSTSHWIEPEALRAEAEAAVFIHEHSSELVSAGGKRFALVVLRLRADG